MTLKEDLEAEVKKIFGSTWTKRDGTVVPDDQSVTLGNDAVELDATVLYADLSDSTKMVNSQTATFAAEVYKSYLVCAGKIIRDRGGVITAYDGDRVMAVFIGNSKNTSAVKAAMKINSAVINIINPAIVKQYSADKYTVKQVVGIDTSKVLVAKTGVRGANDLVWVGRAANYAAKLSSLNDYKTYITDDVYNVMLDEAKFSNGTNMWTQLTWNTMNKMTIYGSNYMWSV
jgi:class 3 adenylate cyclase